MNSIETQSATTLRRLIRKREMSSNDVVNALLGRIQSRESKIGAWQFLDADLALAQARTPGRLGPLEGIPIGVKDVFDTLDMPTSYGSPIYAGNRPGRDATPVARLRAAGAIILGKTVTTEFGAVFEPGKTANPYAFNRSPGGSSSGSAAAVADRMVPLAIGTQTAGSVIRPAAYCGVYGFKPTFGSIGRTGVKPVSPTLDTVGMFARTTDDLLLLYRIMFGRDADDRATHWAEEAGSRRAKSLGTPLRLAYIRTSNWRRAEPATRAAADSAVRALTRTGAIVTEVTLPGLFGELTPAAMHIFDYELRRALESEYSSHRELLSPSILSAIERGTLVRPEAYHRCIAIAATCRRHLATVFLKHDAILAPATVGEAPLITTTGDPIFCRMWTLLGNPAVTVPGMQGPLGLPVGIQIVGDRYRDVFLLRVAKSIASCLPVLPPPSEGYSDVSPPAPGHTTSNAEGFGETPIKSKESRKT